MNKIPEKQTTSISIENQYGKYTIETNKVDLDIHTMIEELIKPVLLACGYHSKMIEEIFE